MPIAIIEAIISSIVPMLITEAEALLGVKPNPSDNSWVSGLINELASLLENILPGWLKPTEEQIVALVTAEIEKILKI